MKFTILTTVISTVCLSSALADKSSYQLESLGIKVGMDIKTVEKIAGTPKWKGRTYTNKIQWDYLQINKNKEYSNHENKIWIVFDDHDKVKEIWDFRACHLSSEPIDNSPKK